MINNGNSVVWLDYSNPFTSWNVQANWVLGLRGQLTYIINPYYIVNRSEDYWRLLVTVYGDWEIGYALCSRTMLTTSLFLFGNHLNKKR